MTESIAIIGGGPVGMLAANALAREGVFVRVFETSATRDDSPRAIAYMSTLLPELERWGVLDGMLKTGIADRQGFNLHLAELGEVISFPFPDAVAAKGPFEYNVVVGQGDLCAVIEEKLMVNANVEVHRGEQLVELDQDADGVSLVTEDAEGKRHTYRAGWVIGADGGRGVTRTFIDAQLEGYTWEEKLVATNVEYDFSQHGFFNTNLFAHPKYGAVVARIDGSGMWRVTFQEDADLPDEGLPERIGAFYRGMLGIDSLDYDLRSFRKYTIHQRTASVMRAGRVVLAGDAAHLTNPTGGQGLTTGIYDVIALEEAFTALFSGRADERILDAYATGRRNAFLKYSSPTAENLKRLVYDRSGDREWLIENTSALRSMGTTPEGQAAFRLGSDIQRTSPLADYEALVRS